MAKVSSIPGGLDVAANRVVKRNSANTAWETSPLKRVETYRGVTSGGGRYTITYGTAFSSAPVVVPSILADSAYRLMARVVSSTASGCVVEVAQRNASFLSLLGLDVLTSGITVQNGVSVDVLVAEV